MENALAAIERELASGRADAARDLGERLVAAALGRLAANAADEAELVLDRLSGPLPNLPSALHYRGVCRHLAGESEAGEALIRRSLSLDPDRADAWCNLGLCLLGLGQADEAADCFHRALRRDPANLNARNNLGAIHLQRGEWAEARDAFALVVAGDPAKSGAAVNLAAALIGCGDAAGAAEICEDLLAEGRADSDVMQRLADAWARLGRMDEAIHVLRQALAAWPTPEAANNLACLLQAEGANAEAAGLCRAVTEAVPEDGRGWFNLGAALAGLGRTEEAAAAYDEALRRNPSAEFLSAKLLTLSDQSDEPASAFLERARAWDAAHGGGRRCVWLNGRDPERRLRVAYLSPDLRRHAVGFFIPGVLAAHDRDQVEVIAYHDHFQSDAVTKAAMAGCDVWREVHGLSDDALIDQIQADGVDVLIDCAGHSGGNRLRALARKPAPVQMSWVLGHGGTTGLAAMDRVLADAVLAPEDEAGAEFAETVVRLPIFAPFRPDPAWPEVAPLAEGAPLLACLANPARINEPLLAAWSRILDRLPGSRLLLRHGAYGRDPYWAERFAGLGERVILDGLPGGWDGAVDGYGQISLALDTFPASGATSILIPLWMGVPTVSLRGGRAAGRFGASILVAAGLDDFVAHSWDEYVDKAARLAADGARLAEIRRDIRARMSDGPVCDAAGFARSVERACREAWRQAAAQDSEGWS